MEGIKMYKAIDYYNRNYHSKKQVKTHRFNDSTAERQAIALRFFENKADRQNMDGGIDDETPRIK